MKKISILLTGLAFSVGFGQVGMVSEVSGTPDFSTEGTNEVILEQIEFGTAGIVSDSQEGGDLVASADDFDLEYDFTKITKLSAFGFSNTSDLAVTLTGVSFYIIADEDWYPAGGSPAVDAAYKFEMAMGDAGFNFVDNGDSSYEFTLDLTALDEDVVLPAGKYWLSVVANSDVVDFVTAAGRWNWYQTLTANGIEGHLIDPSDIFGAGATSWLGLSSLVDWTNFDLAMRIEGEESTMGVSDLNATTLAVYPNPANEVVNVTLKNAEVKTLSVTNLAGQTVVTTKNSSVNVSALPAGVYVVRVVDTKGAVHTSKVVVK